MPLIVPDARELQVIQDYLGSALTMKLYSNNVTPSSVSAAGDFNEVAGGGYVSKALAFANWNISAGDPTAAVYNVTQEWNFTGATTAPGTIYGYFVTRNSDGMLMWAERFPAANVPFTPIAGSLIRVLPRFQVQSAN